jgi:hypothetical protein
MNIWHPAPRGLINTAATERWTRKRPAPDIVVYLWIWSQRDEGAPPTRRQVAKVFGWTEHHSRKLIERVKADMNEWRLYISPRGSAGKRPAGTSDSKTLRDSVAQVSHRIHQGSPDRGRVSTLQQHNNTETEACLEGMKEWQALK